MLCCCFAKVDHNLSVFKHSVVLGLYWQRYDLWRMLTLNKDTKHLHWEPGAASSSLPGPLSPNTWSPDHREQQHTAELLCGAANVTFTSSNQSAPSRRLDTFYCSWRSREIEIASNRRETFSFSLVSVWGTRVCQSPGLSLKAARFLFPY